MATLSASASMRSRTARSTSASRPTSLSSPQRRKYSVMRCWGVPSIPSGYRSAEAIEIARGHRFQREVFRDVVAGARGECVGASGCARAIAHRAPYLFATRAFREEPPRIAVADELACAAARIGDDRYARGHRLEHGIRAALVGSQH